MLLLLCCSYRVDALLHCSFYITELQFDALQYMAMVERFCYRKNGLGVNKELPFYSTSVIFQSFVLKNFFCSLLKFHKVFPSFLKHNVVL